MKTLEEDTPVVSFPTDGRRVPLSRHIRVELRKLVDTRAGKWLLVAIALFTTAAIVAFLLAGKKQDLTFAQLVGVTATPQAILLPVLGILAVTSEWSQRTVLVTFTLEPSRLRIVYAKLIAIVLLGTLFVALAIALAIPSNLVGAHMFGGDGSWKLGLAGVRDILLIQLTGLLAGAALGMVLMNSAAAIVTSFAIPAIFSILRDVVPRTKHVIPWIDLGTAQQPLMDHDISTDGWARLIVTSIWWIVLPLLVGLWRLLNKEVK